MCLFCEKDPCECFDQYCHDCDQVIEACYCYDDDEDYDFEQD